jgi:uncharacterized membrane protein YsdA (DUF1294 family)
MLVTKKKGGERLIVFRCILSFIGGGAGNLLAFLLFGREATKENMTFVVISVSLPVIYSVVVFGVYGPLEFDTVNFIDNLFNVPLLVWIYLIAVNLVSFIMFGVDKYRAVKEKSRIPILTLLASSFIGGSLGGIIAMYLFRHKTKKSYFSLGMPLIMLAQLLVFCYLVGVGIL